jgi:hypothetical protein
LSDAAGWFRIVDPIERIEMIAAGRSVRERARLRKTHGGCGGGS